MSREKFETVEQYIATFPPDVRAVLEKLRQTIKEAEPLAQEKISYNIPAFEYHGMLIYFSAYKKHCSISIPPPFSAFEAYREELSSYEVSKSAVQFPFDRPIPYELIGEMTRFLAKENKERAEKGKKKK
ncbi:iron chaperone [Paenibacillus koleovorans]|uniref:iron chaperone n=1 Tax=Paenibacillus koleovorans TaxID=121608 RepID=UPI000FD7F37A|nr:DUF1801 domain-containing protein [Paenibacillus koleovorans]